MCVHSAAPEGWQGPGNAKRPPGRKPAARNRGTYLQTVPAPSAKTAGTSHGRISTHAHNSTDEWLGSPASVPETSAHLVQPIPGPAAVPEGLLLDPAPDLIDGVPAELDQVEGVERVPRSPTSARRRTQRSPTSPSARSAHPRTVLAPGVLPRSVDHRQAAEERASLRPEWVSSAPRGLVAVCGAVAQLGRTFKRC